MVVATRALSQQKSSLKKQKRQGLSLDMDDNDDFDSMAKSLLFEARAQASDRTKTAAERRRKSAKDWWISRHSVCVGARRFPGRRRRRRRWGQPGGRG